jgi:crossover junction endodeoxyribonuclease RuvC
MGKLILGIDPGSHRTGYGILAIDSGKILYRDCGVIHATPSLEYWARVAQIRESFSHLLDQTSPDSVSIEKAYVGKNVRSALALGQVRGVLIGCAMDRGVSVSEYEPSMIKKAVTGNGNAPKAQIGQMVALTLGLKSAPPEDAADALAIGLCHAAHLHNQFSNHVGNVL